MGKTTKLATAAAAFASSLVALMLTAPPASADNSDAIGPISSLANGKCMDAAGGNSGDGTAVQIYPCNNSTAQEWSVRGDDTLRVLGKCAEAAGSGGSLKVRLWSCYGADNQRWEQRPDGTLRNVAAGLCIDIPGNASDSTQLEARACTGQGYQRWKLPTTGAIIHAASRKCMDVAGNNDADGTAVQIYPCSDNNAAQRWTLTNGTIQAKGKCLDAGTMNIGAKLTIRTCTNGAAQKWRRDTSDHLINQSSGICVGAPNTNDSTQLDLRTCNQSSNVIWYAPSDTI
ncbi:RICIN domain-containing protein [Streptomyces hygroscopicus]|uniref:RICIN domain-containing protein n=1 Tax=Streptomyces hygroscopicus TaxID=1912 RepID=UPI00076776E6|nr:RICIN domain-containing protein [Streptomyces hygroscopicus]GLV76314.1 hypothetical protein Shyhy02_43140 [Streptomyces hygroscopicus subsp. hygroscopicus]